MLKLILSFLASASKATATHGNLALSGQKRELGSLAFDTAAQQRTSKVPSAAALGPEKRRRNRAFDSTDAPKTLRTEPHTPRGARRVSSQNRSSHAAISRDKVHRLQMLPREVGSTSAHHFPPRFPQMFLKRQAFIFEAAQQKSVVGGKSTSPAFRDTERSPATSPSRIPAKHIWKPNNSFRFLRRALLLRRFSITPAPPAAAGSGIPSTTKPVMAVSVRLFRRSKGSREGEARSGRSGGTSRVGASVPGQQI